MIGKCCSKFWSYCSYYLCKDFKLSLGRYECACLSVFYFVCQKTFGDGSNIVGFFLTNAMRVCHERLCNHGR